MSRIVILSVVLVSQLGAATVAVIQFHRANVLNRQTAAWVDDLQKRAASAAKQAKEAEAVCKAADEASSDLLKNCTQGGTLGPGENCTIPMIVIPTPPVAGTSLPAKRLPKT